MHKALSLKDKRPYNLAHTMHPMRPVEIPEGCFVHMQMIRENEGVGKTELETLYASILVRVGSLLVLAMTFGALGGSYRL